MAIATQSSQPASAAGASNTSSSTNTSATIPPIRFSASTVANTLSAFTPLPSVRAPAAAASVVAPLPAIRAPARQNESDTVAPLPRVRTARADSPDQEEDVADKQTEDHEEMETVDDVPIEETEPVLNPARTEQSSATQVAALTASTDRSMVDQTMRSFESRPGTSNRAKAPVPSSSTLGRTASASSVVVTFDDVAPSDLEIYQQAGLLSTTKGERVAAHRVRTDENELRIGTHIVAILRRIEQLEKKSSAQFSELLMRIEDNARNTGSQTTSITSPAISADMDCLKDMVIEGRAAITSLTEAVNGLVDLPRDVSRLSRTVQALSFAEKPATKGLAIHPNGAASKDMALASKDIVPYSIARTTPSPAEQDDEIFPGFDVRGRSSAHESSTSGSKRSSTFAGFDVRPNNKKSKTHDDEPTHTDVYLWEVNLEVSPMATAHHSMAQLNMAEYIPNIMSVACPRNTKNLISIRFRALAIAELFVERLRSNPPKSMEKLEAVKRDSYEKKGKAKDKGTGPWYT